MQKYWKKCEMVKIGHSKFFLNHSNAKILEEIQNGQNWAFQIFLSHSNAKILEEIGNGQNWAFQIF